MAGKARTWWRGWRERQKQKRLDRALNNLREPGAKGIDPGKHGYPGDPGGAGSGL